MTIGDAIENVQLVLWPRAFARYRGRCKRSALLVWNGWRVGTHACVGGGRLGLGPVGAGAGGLTGQVVAVGEAAP